MTIAEIQADEKLRQKEFPVTTRQTFLGHAAVCPLPRRVSDAMASFASRCTEGDQEMILPEMVSQARDLGAKVLNCKPEEVGFVGPTSVGLSYVASGLRFRKGENIVIYYEDYPSNVYPWMAFANQGIQVRLLNVRQLGMIRPKDVIGQVDENTRLVALSSCHYVSGYRLQVNEIAEAMHMRRILFCLDAIQTVGAFPTPLEHVTFLAADSHKWLLGPCGTGLFYVKQYLQKDLTPPVYGWHNVRCPNFIAQEQISYQNGMAKFEAGTHNLIGIAGIIAAMELALELGIDNIATDLLNKRAMLVPELQSKGYTVLQADAGPENASGIVSFFKPDENMLLLHRKLTDANVVASLRADRGGQRYIRLSPHYYNTEAELKRVLKML